MRYRDERRYILEKWIEIVLRLGLYFANFSLVDCLPVFLDWMQLLRDESSHFRYAAAWLGLYQRNYV